MNHLFGSVIDNVKQGIILQQVNAQGVMASGVAKGIREKWPVVWDAYFGVVGLRHAHTKGMEHMGKMIPVEVSRDLWICNIVGQQFYGRDGVRYTSYDALDIGLQQVGALARSMGFTDKDVHHPLIGCGLGGGNWSIVSVIIQQAIGPDTTLWTLD